MAQTNENPWGCKDGKGCYCDAESRIGFVMGCDDIKRLAACLKWPDTQKSVKLQIGRRLKKLAAAQTETVARERVEANEILAPEKPGAVLPPYAPDAVTAQYKRAVAGALEMVRFGAMLVEIDMSLTRETHNGGCFQTGETLKAWLEANCPDVNYKTAMRFKALAEGVQRSCNVPAKVPLSLAMPKDDGTFNVPDESPIPFQKLKKIQQEVWSLVEGKSARQLQFAFAADEAAPKGGDRRSDKKLTEEEKHEQMVKAANAVWNTGVDALVDNVKRLKSHMLLTGDTVGKLLVKVGIIIDALNDAASTKE